MTDSLNGENSNTAVIIVAGGRGSRSGLSVPKQYHKIAGKTVLEHTIRAFCSTCPDSIIQCVIHRDDVSQFDEIACNYPNMKPAVFGGETRQESVFNGLNAVSKLGVDHVLIHDAARPFVSEAVIDGVFTAINSGAKAVIPGVQVVDSLKRTNDDHEVIDSPARDNVYRAQTPQGFQFDELLKAHEALNGQNFSDDAGMMQDQGHVVLVSQGDEANFKITTREDVKRAENMMMQQLADIRTGQGYDVHRFEDGDHVWLGGIEIPHTMALKGHSDADVALHALTDALLSAIADGDIGTHFPPTDEKWRDVSSDKFLAFAAERIAAKCGIIAHVAVTIICETPKIGPHKEKITARIANILGIDVGRVAIQATTTEKLGFTGRGEGIAAQATATVRLPFA